MCNCLLDILKCPGSIACCCCECACQLILCIVCSAVVVFVIIGVTVYFTMYEAIDSHNADEVQKVQRRIIRAVAPQDFRDFFGEVN